MTVILLLGLLVVLLAASVARDQVRTWRELRAIEHYRHALTRLKTITETTTNGRSRSLANASATRRRASPSTSTAGCCLACKRRQLLLPAVKPRVPG